MGNLLHCLGSKAIHRAVQKQQQPSESAMNALKESMEAARDNGVEIPAGIQALATHFIK